VKTELLFGCKINKMTKLSEYQNKEKKYIEEHKEIIDSSDTNVVVELEWAKDGDYFQKFSMYDDSYIQIGTLEGTTLTKAF